MLDITTLTSLGAAASAPLPPAIAQAIVDLSPAYEIDQRLRVINFLAQAMEETGAWKWMVELGGPSYFAKYDGREDLGNTQPGDGYLFRGRGIFQITGRANYAKYGDELDLDLVNNPDLASTPHVAVQIAFAYWSDHGCNALADADDIEAITRKINGGLNGFQARQSYADAMKAAWPSVPAPAA